jgi:UDP-N-acetylglucosamine:LPS N-acetylglucosamine transferase
MQVNVAARIWRDLFLKPLDERGTLWLNIVGSRGHFDTRCASCVLEPRGIVPPPTDGRLLLKLLTLAHATISLASAAPARTPRVAQPAKQAQRPLLIVSARMGSGHNKVASIVADAWRTRHGRPVEIVDLVEIDPAFEAFSRMYAAVAVSGGPRYELIFEWAEQLHREAFLLNQALLEKIAKHLTESFSPAAVLAVHPTGAQLAPHLKAAAPATPVMTLVTDWFEGCLSTWIHPDADVTFCPDERNAAHLAHVNPLATSKIRVLAPVFERAARLPTAAEREEARHRLGLSGDDTGGSVCVVNTNGSVQFAQTLSDRLRHRLRETGARLPTTVVALCCRSDEVARALSDIPGVRPVLWAESMRDWLWAADLIVTKPGPGITQHALACGCPVGVDLIHPAMNQEQGVADHVTRAGVGPSIATWDSLIDLLFDPVLAEGCGRWRGVIAANPLHNGLEPLLDAMAERLEASLP